MPDAPKKKGPFSATRNLVSCNNNNDDDDDNDAGTLVSIEKVFITFSILCLVMFSRQILRPMYVICFQKSPVFSAVLRS